MAGFYQIPTIINNTTSKAIPIQLLDKFKNPIILTNASIHVQFRKDCETGEVVYDITVGNGVTITDDLNGWFEIDLFLLVWGEGLYFYDIKTGISGIDAVYIVGERIVKQNITQN